MTGKLHDVAVVSDLHGFFPKIESANLLIVAGDLCDRIQDEFKFVRWVEQLIANNVICAAQFIPGNHDINVDDTEHLGHADGLIANVCAGPYWFNLSNKRHPKGFKIAATGFSWTFCGNAPMLELIWARMTPYLDKIKRKVKSIPKIDLDGADASFLVAHGPPAGILDKNSSGESCGTPGLFEWACNNGISHILCGHIHEQGGKYETHDGITVINAARATMYMDFQEGGLCVISGSRWT
jgi:Icc-related predicted phosphoesterase